MSKIDGGPAFPAYDGFDRFPGIGARDYFAAAALTGMMGYLTDSKQEAGLCAAAKENGMAVAPYLAAVSYKMADAMLAEREKGE